jgi:predicted deacylase
MIKAYMLKTYHFSAPLSGPKLLVLGAIHGNEKCGTMAIAAVMAELEAKLFSLAKGSVTFVPICNPKAYLAHQRYVDHNLNRLIGATAPPPSYEATLAPFIEQLIDAHDVLLDLHSYTSGRGPFLFLDHDTAEQRAYGGALNLPAWVLNWNDSYRKAAASLGALTPNAAVCDTSGYAIRQGKMEMTVECGTHDDPYAPDVAKTAILGALHHFGLITEKPPYHKVAAHAPTLYRMTDIIRKEKAGQFTRPYLHFDPVQKGDCIARYDDGTAITAPADAVILLPDEHCALQQEWFYLGQRF